jgi:outer membrane protein TolC
MVAAAALPLVLAGCATSSAAKRPSEPADWRAEMQPALMEEEAEELAEGLGLARAVQLGAERNPSVAAARERWLARIKVEPQALTPPDPMLEAGYQFRSTETRVGPVDGSLGLRQTLPWPGKLWARGRVAATGADIAQLQYEAALRDLIVDVKGAYYELFYLDQAIPVVNGIEEMLRNDALLAYSELTVGRTALSEAFRAESQSAQLAYDRLLLAEQRDAQAERLKSLLNLPPDTLIGPVREAPVYDVSPDLEELYARAETYAEVLKIKGLETQRAAYETYLAKLSRIPDITLGGTYTFVDEARTMTTVSPSGTVTTSKPPAGSGKDPVNGMVSMNLPIFVWRNNALIQEQKAMERAMRLDALDELNRVRAGVARAMFNVRLTQRLGALYDDTLLPQAQSVMEQAEVLYRNDGASFSNLIETTLAYQNFTLARLRVRADHGQAIGELERVLGTTAEARPPETPGPEAAKEDAMTVEGALE